MVDETGLANYRRRLGEWEDERERQLHEFTITENDLVPKRENIRYKGRTQGSSNSSQVIAQLNSTAREVEVSKQQLLTSVEQKLYKPYKV